MRLVDFLMELLKAQGRTLQALEQALGEDRLVELLENQPEPTPAPFKNTIGHRSPSYQDPYALLQSAVDAIGLSPVLEFYLWSFPPYRRWIESELELDSKIDTVRAKSAVEDTVTQARDWRIGILTQLGHHQQTDALFKATDPAWIRFRTESLRHAGVRHVG